MWEVFHDNAEAMQLEIEKGARKYYTSRLKTCDPYFRLTRFVELCLCSNLIRFNTAKTPSKRWFWSRGGGSVSDKSATHARSHTSEMTPKGVMHP